MGSAHPEIERFQQRIGHSFRDGALLRDALRHPSAAAARPEAVSNQRLEFLGDAVLQIIISEALFRSYPQAREGELSRRRASLTKGVFLAELGRELGIDRMLELSPAEELSGGRNRASALEDACEALAGAIYLDAGIEAARNAVLQWYGPLALRLTGAASADNPKGRIQELVQPEHGNDALRYEVILIKGQPHDRHFDVHLHLLGKIIGTGTGRSKKEAEENAAHEALRQWKISEPN